MKKPYSIQRMDSKNVLVLGGLGFIGSNIAQKCVDLGAKVTVFDSMIQPYGFNLANIAEIKNRVEFLKQDMRNFNDLAGAVKGKDCILNCAGQVSHIDSMTNPYLDIELNIVANMNLLEACRKFNDNAKIVFAGTRAQTGREIYIPVDENHPDNPVDIYGADKLTAEKHLLVYSRIYGMKGTSVRLNTTFGPRHQMKHNLYGVLNWFIRLAMENKKITVFGDGSQLREYTFVDDAVDAMLLAAQKNTANGQVYFLGAKKSMKFIDMVREVLNQCQSGSFELVAFPPERKSIEIGDFKASFKKIRKHLGWQPTTTFKDGLKKTIEFYKKNKEHYF